MKTTAINLYNPAQKEKETLINEFVIRTKEFKIIFEDIQNSKMDIPEQHYLIVGQRGMGKTTLLWRILYAIEDDPKLNKKLIPVIFSEEQYNIFSLSQFWEEVAIYLGNIYLEYISLYNEMTEHEEKENYLSISFEILEKTLKKNKQHIVVLIDNFGFLLDKINEKEAYFFRKTLMTSNIIRIIATSSVVLEHTFRYDKPFFEFFYEMRLEPLTRQASIDLLKALAEVHHKIGEINKLIKNEPHRIEALRRITGGVPRTMALLFEIFMDNSNGESFEYLQELTDKVTALYKHRMDGLKPQQQQIIDALARAWEPIGTQEILKKSKLYRKNIQSNQISAQLKQLKDNQLIEIVNLTGKKKAYRIRERFFNIWYLMRYGRKNSKEQILFLIRFFEEWCNVSELINMSKEMQHSFKSEKCDFSSQAAYFKSLALFETAYLPAVEKNILKESTVAYLKKANKPDLANQFIKQTTGETKKLFNKAFKAHLNKNYPEAEKYYLQAVEKGDPKASNNLALLYKEQGKLEEAEKYYLQAVKKGIALARYNLALLYKEQGKNLKAEKYYLQAIKKGIVEASNNLALLYKEQGKTEKAEKYYLQAIKKGIVEANYNLALLYKEQGKTKEAEKYYLQAIKKGIVEPNNDLAILYNEQGKTEEAEKYFLQAVEKGDHKASHNLANLYREQDKTEEAEKYYLQAIKKGIVEAAIILIILEVIKSNFTLALKTLKKGAEAIKSKDKMLLQQIIMVFIFYKQYEGIYQVFKEFELKEELLPMYYALMYFMRDKFPNEYLKTNPEIKETVDEIIEVITKEQKRLFP